MDGLSNLTTVSGNLIIEINIALTNVDGLSNLTTILGYLYIGNNSALTNLDGLSNLTTISGNLDIVDNDALTNCCGIQELLVTPGAIGGQITIYDNPSECSSEEEILDSDCSNYNYAEGNVYLDVNADGCDSADILYPNLKFKFIQDSIIRYRINNSEGNIGLQ
ncbi:MAG: hypothetical protein R2771_00650 [Saprospiraceae bacterium]